MTDTTRVLRVRPKSEMTRTAWLTFFITVIPLFAVLYWYTAPLGAWPQILVAQLALAAACLGADIRQRMVFTAVTASTLEGNGIFSRRETVPLDDIQSVALVSVYGTYPNETNTQMVALDAAGRCLFRMRGYFWHSADIAAVCAAVGRPVTEPSAPLSEDEFFTAYPGSRYWFERNAPVRFALFAGTALLIALAVLVLVWAAGVPILR